MFDCQETGRALLRMTGDVVHNVFTPCIWSLCVLRDSTVISGDSKGQVQIWNGSVGALIGSFVQHAADVLTLAVNEEETCVFGSGIDGKVICLQRESPSSDIWVYTHSHRAHSHDVYCLAVCRSRNDLKNSTATSSSSSSSGGGGSGSGGSSQLLISGGLDAKLCLYSVNEFSQTRPTWLPVVPTNDAVMHSENYKSIVMGYRNRLDIWGLDCQVAANKNEVVSSSDRDENCKLVARITSSRDNLKTFAISPDGSVLLASSSNGVKGWRLESVDNAPMLIVKMSLPKEFLSSSPKEGLSFNKDGRIFTFFDYMNSSIELYTLKASEVVRAKESPILAHYFSIGCDFGHKHLLDNSVDSKLSAGVKKMDFSWNDNFLACCGRYQRVSVYDLRR